MRFLNVPTLMPLRFQRSTSAVTCFGFRFSAFKFLKPACARCLQISFTCALRLAWVLKLPSLCIRVSF
jgi:hypothetical protein